MKGGELVIGGQAIANLRMNNNLQDLALGTHRGAILATEVRNNRNCVARFPLVDNSWGSPWGSHKGGAESKNANLGCNSDCDGRLGEEYPEEKAKLVPSMHRQKRVDEYTKSDDAPIGEKLPSERSP